jgi:hypothetical protein
VGGFCFGGQKILSSCCLRRNTQLRSSHPSVLTSNHSRTRTTYRSVCPRRVVHARSRTDAHARAHIEWPHQQSLTAGVRFDRRLRDCNSFSSPTLSRAATTVHVLFTVVRRNRAPQPQPHSHAPEDRPRARGRQDLHNPQGAGQPTQRSIFCFDLTAHVPPGSPPAPTSLNRLAQHRRSCHTLCSIKACSPRAPAHLRGPTTRHSHR